MFFSIMDVKLFKEFYLKKMRLDPFNKAFPSGFKFMLLKWVQSATPKAFAIEEITLDTHYKFNCVGSMARLKKVVDMPKSTSFL